MLPLVHMQNHEALLTQSLVTLIAKKVKTVGAIMLHVRLSQVMLGMAPLGKALILMAHIAIHLPSRILFLTRMVVSQISQYIPQINNFIHRLRFFKRDEDFYCFDINDFGSLRTER